MNIAVLIKQVPSSQEVKIDSESGVLLRYSAPAHLNPYDLFSIETSLRMRESIGGTVTAITMGPFSAINIIYDAYAMGVDNGVLLCDPAFAGSDVFATSYTLSQAIKTIGKFDLYICGRQSTDGDTAQTGPALAAQLDIPLLNWVIEISHIDSTSIIATQQLSSVESTVNVPFPCVLVVNQDIFSPRVAPLRLKLTSKKKPIHTLHLSSLPDKNPQHYGILGSPTSVSRVYSPEKEIRGQWLSGTLEEIVSSLQEKVGRHIRK